MKKVNKTITLIIGFIMGIIVTAVVGYAATILFNSNEVGYNNTNSGLLSTDVQGAIDELYSFALNKECKVGYKKQNETSDSYECVVPPTAVEIIMAKENFSSQVNQIPNTDIYIFKGENPANYVKFNNEDWRIIGIYGDQLKIQRVGAPTGLTSIQYNTSTPNPGWANSSLKTYLNETYYGTLSSVAKKKIDENGSWNVGAVVYTANASQAYTSATTTSTVGSTTHTTPWTGKVGLMATYEFLYASGGSSCLTTSGYNYNGGCGTVANDWMNPGSSSWSLSPRSGATDRALIVSSSGSVNYVSVNNSSQALPAVFLKSSVTIASGDGSSTSTAYVLE